MPHIKRILSYFLAGIFVFLSLNRIIGGYLHLIDATKSNFNSPFFSPFGTLGTLGISPLPRAYTGLGFSDSIEVYIITTTSDYLIDLNFNAIDNQAKGHLYKYDVFLHSLFWPIKAPDIKANADKILTYMICRDLDFLKTNNIDESPKMAAIVRKSTISSSIVWKKYILCEK